MKPIAVAIVLGLAAAAFARPAAAFHSGRDYDKSVYEGGSGGVYYLGTKAERGWTCTMCHTEAPGTLKMQITSEPPELALEQRYVPGTRYQIDVAMIVAGQELGAANPQANYNALALTFVDESGEPHGNVSGKADLFLTIDFSTLVVTGNNPRETTWQLAWTPRPEPGKGVAHLHIGIVDGNAGGKVGETFTDPFDDEVLMAHFVLAESPAPEARAAPPPGPAPAPTSFLDTRVSTRPNAVNFGGLDACLLALSIPRLGRRRRRRVR